MKSVPRFFRRNKVVIVVAVVFLLYVGVTLVRQEIKLKQLKNEEANRQTEIALLKEDVAELSDELENASSSDTIERIAREKLKMVKSNEIIYIIQEDESDDGEMVTEISD